MDSIYLLLPYKMAYLLDRDVYLFFHVIMTIKPENDMHVIYNGAVLVTLSNYSLKIFLKTCNIIRVIFFRYSVGKNYDCAFLMTKLIFLLILSSMIARQNRGSSSTCPLKTSQTNRMTSHFFIFIYQPTDEQSTDHIVADNSQIIHSIITYSY